MFYKDYITLNNKFNKSTNIVYDKEDCENYIITTSAKNTLQVLFKLDYHNSISIIGPFGSGKSSLLLYINTLLADTKNSQKCMASLEKTDLKLYEKFKIFNESKKFLRIKIVGEHISFKEQFKSTILNIKELKQTIKYLKENNFYQLSKVLNLINIDLETTEFTDILFSVDEFGKFIEFSFDNIDSNDIFELQTLSEFVNKQNNYKLIVSLHKVFNEYTQGSSSSITYSDWDKIQGRFENIVFKDDYYEMLNLFKETISHNESKLINDTKKLIDLICDDESFKNNIKSENLNELFKQIIPIHPYSVLVIAEMFSKYFQNQRSIYSFIFSSEPSAFQEFLDKEQKRPELYTLANLYDYISYLLKVYSIQLPDDEIWYLSDQRIKDQRIKDQIQIDIIKTISLIHTFKLVNTILPNKEHITLSLIDRYSKGEILKSLTYLEESNILVYQEQTKSFSLLEDSNIDINKELKNLLTSNFNFDHELKLNEFITDKFVVAKRYFAEYGSKREFEKRYISKNIKELDKPYKIFFIESIDDENVKKSISNNIKSVFIPLDNISKLHELIEKIEALNIILDNFKSKISIETNEIIQNMIADAKQTLENTFNSSFEKSHIYFDNKKEKYTSRNLQNILSKIAQTNFDKCPILNNYTLNHTVANKGTNTTAIKLLFDRLLNNSHEENLGFDPKKYPAEKALYLSVIKPSGIHTNLRLTKPTDKLNFEYIWDQITNFLNKRKQVVDLIDELSNEPFGLNRSSALFMISLFIIVNKDNINLFRDNTYKYELAIDLIMNMWKVPEKYELQFIKLSSKEKALFKAYIQIATDITDFEYSKDKVVAIIRTLYNKFTALPEFAQKTQKISDEAKALRSALKSTKEPNEAFFKMFPKALGYDNIEKIDIDEFISKFKNAFNQIALSYKKELISLENFLSVTFHLKSKSFPFENSLIDLADKLEDIKQFDSEIKALIRNFKYTNSLIDLLDSCSVIFIGKKIDKCSDNDIVQLKEKLSKVSNEIFAKLELKDIANDQTDVRKISLSSLDSNLNKVISIERSKIDDIQDKALKLKEQIPKTYTIEEKLYLISQLLNEELLN